MCYMAWSPYCLIIAIFSGIQVRVDLDLLPVLYVACGSVCCRRSIVSFCHFVTESFLDVLGSLDETHSIPFLSDR